MQKFIPFILYFSLFGFFFSGCGPDDLFFEKKEIQDPWNQSDSLEFTFEVQDTSLLYNMYLITDFATSYNKQNLYFKIDTEFPNGKKNSVIRSIDFFDTQGKPRGDCSSTNCVLRSFLQENAFFNLQGSYKITVAQHSRIELLEGVNSIALEVEKGKPRRGE